MFPCSGTTPSRESPLHLRICPRYNTHASNYNHKHTHTHKRAHTHKHTHTFCFTYGHLCVVGGVAGSDASPTCISQQIQHLFLFLVFSIFVLVPRSNTLVSGHQVKEEIFTSLNSPICSTRFFTQASFSPLRTLSKTIQ